MDDTKDPVYLRNLAASVDKFRDEFKNLLELFVFTNISPGLAPPIIPRDGVTDEAIADAKERVSRAAGRIAHLPAPARVKIAVAGSGAFDVFEAWLTVTQPKPLFFPDDVLAVSNQVIGRLEAMAERAEREAPVRVDTEDMHPLVWGAARGLWNDEHYREAVSTAVGAVIDHVRQLTGYTALDEKDVLAHAFSSNVPRPNEPRLRWPGDQDDQTVRSMNRGLLQFGMGLQAAIRNPAIHDRTEMAPQAAAERLAAISLLAGWIEQCERIDVDGSLDVD